MAELDSFPNQQPQDSDEVVAAHDSNGDGTLDHTVNWTWGSMKDALDSAGYARTDVSETFENQIAVKSRIIGQARIASYGLGTFGDSDYEFMEMRHANDKAYIRSFASGSGTERPIVFGVGLAEYGTLTRTGYWGFGGETDPSYAVDADGTIRAQDKLLTDFSDPAVFSAREVKSGTSAPSDSEGKNGDIYIQTN